MIKKVPFVEMYNGRIQGVVSSGSDIRRVYVAFFSAETLNFNCTTNNNRPCGGLSGRPCKHLFALLNAAVAQYGFEQVVNFLKFQGDPALLQTNVDIVRNCGTKESEAANEIFSRFLSYLQYLELPSSDQPNPDLAWFV